MDERTDGQTDGPGQCSSGEFRPWLKILTFSIETKFEKLFLLRLKDTLFNGCYYDQIDGVAMGSPLAPLWVNLFMGFHADQWLSNYKDSQVLFYRRYVDDTFCLFDIQQDAMLFFNYINSGHPNIKFTFETQLIGKLPFLDVLVDNSTPSCVMSIYH